MYTQCPTCQTVFRITMEQLQAHNGTVRCGHCTKVFNADQQLFDDIPAVEKEKKPASTSKKRTGGKAKPATTRAPRRAKEKPAEVEVEEIVAAEPPLAPIEIATPATVATPEDAALRADFLFRKRRRGPASAWWIAGNALLALVLLAQATYFYRDALASSEILRPTLEQWCDRLGCDLLPRADVARIELIQPTKIEPHPKFENILRLRATMVNRANVPQPFPLMEITLTDTVGAILARRSFTPEEYLVRLGLTETEMFPHVAINAQLDITNPDNKASGYEINFVADNRK
jgi:predicted Zn finger-like uncharacterized protein